jgi:4-amino-4-deoxy-L-arabinose transferase-like glycosyltransferase
MSLENHKGKVLFLLLGLALVRGLLYSAVVPPWQAPDEPRHFEYVRLLYEKRRLVGWGDVTPSVEQEIIGSMWRFDYLRYGYTDAPPPAPDELPTRFNEIWAWPGTEHELHQPPLAYLVYLMPLALTATQDTALQLYALRLISVLQGVAVVIIAFQIANELFPDKPRLALAIPAFVTFLPMHTFMTSTINNDHLAEVFVCLLLLILVRGFRRGFSLWSLVTIILVIIAGLLAKRTAFIAMAISVIALPLYLWRRPFRRALSWRQALLSLAAVLGILVLVAAIILYWSQAVAEANRIGSWRDWLVQFYLFLPSELFPASFRHKLISPQALQIYQHYLWFLFQTFWARFGWQNIPLDGLGYYLLAEVSLVALLGLGLFAIRAGRRVIHLEWWQRRVLILFALSIVMAGALVIGREIRNWDLNLARGGPGWPSGRYLFPVIIPIATLFVLGWSELAPKRHRAAWTIALLGLLILLDSFSLFFLIIPYFYG